MLRQGSTERGRTVQITAEQGDGLLVARVHEDRIDAACAIQFKDRMREIAQMPGNPVILDLSHVGFLDSSGLGAVVAVMKMLGPDRRLELAGPTPPVMKVFRLTRMNSVFTLHDRVPDGFRNAG